MRALLLALPILLLTTVAHAKEIYRCETEGSRYFAVSKDAQGNFSGKFQDFTGKPEAFDCERTDRGYSFKCTKGDYIVTVRRDAYGDMVVDFELAGDFFPDSGYLFQIACK